MCRNTRSDVSNAPSTLLGVSSDRWFGGVLQRQHISEASLKGALNRHRHNLTGQRTGPDRSSERTASIGIACRHRNGLDGRDADAGSEVAESPLRAGPPRPATPIAAANASKLGSIEWLAVEERQ